MNNRKQKISDFFTVYAARFNNALEGKEPAIEETINSFTECFVESSPLGVNCGKNDQEFGAKIKEGYNFYKSIGTKSMSILSNEITLLDDYHAMAKIHWRSDYVKRDNSEVTIDFDIYYFVQTKEDQIKIFAYIAGDESKALQKHGLSPYK